MFPEFLDFNSLLSRGKKVNPLSYSDINQGRGLMGAFLNSHIRSFLLTKFAQYPGERIAVTSCIVPREELLMQKNSRSAFESVSVRCKM